MQAAENEDGASPDDEALVRQARGGDAQAAGELVARYRDAMVRFCFGYLGRVEDAEDAAQDVLAGVSAGGRLPDGKFRPWIYRAARNRCLNVRKRRPDGRAGVGSFLGDSRWPSAGTGPRTALLRDERRERVRRLVAAMPEPHREVLILRYIEGLRRKEIAEVLELTDAVVKSRLFKAAQRLKEHVGDTESWS